MKNLDKEKRQIRAAYKSKYSDKSVVYNLMKKALDTILKDPDITSMDGLAEEMGLYRELFYYLRDRYEDSFKIYDKIKRIEVVLSYRLQKKTLNNEVHPGAGIFLMKAQFGMSETQKVEIEQVADDEDDIDWNALTDDQLNEIEAIVNKNKEKSEE